MITLTPFYSVSRAFAYALTLGLMGGLLAAPAIAQKPLGVVKSDSHTLSSSGDTATTTFSTNVSSIMVDVSGGDIHYNLSDTDATDADFPKWDDQPPLILRDRWTTTIDVVSDAGNGSAVTVWIKGLK